VRRETEDEDEDEDVTRCAKEKRNRRAYATEQNRTAVKQRIGTRVMIDDEEK
jgi:hypothetical protein